jgi:hypothetical protein
MVLGQGRRTGAIERVDSCLLDKIAEDAEVEFGKYGVLIGSNEVWLTGLVSGMSNRKDESLDD